MPRKRRTSRTEGPSRRDVLLVLISTLISTFGLRVYDGGVSLTERLFSWLTMPRQIELQGAAICTSTCSGYLTTSVIRPEGRLTLTPQLTLTSVTQPTGHLDLKIEGTRRLIV